MGNDVYRAELGVNSWQNINRAWWHQSTRAQDYAKPSLLGYSDYYRKPREMTREMTAEDIGLPLVQWSYTWLERAYGLDWRALSAAVALDAPYSFWLGADHG